jgi:predicted phage tail protein
MLRRIRLYGALATFVGHRVLQADVNSAAEAIRYLVANWPELESHMADQHYRVSIGRYDLAATELHDPSGAQEISIVPVVVGAGTAGRIILGVALIALSFVSFGGTAFAGAGGAGGLAAFGGTGAAWGSTALFGIGASLVLGGVAQLLSPVPVIPQGVGSDQDPRKTYNFSGLQQTSRQGTPVPIVYGKTLCGSVVISAGVDTVQVKA